MANENNIERGIRNFNLYLAEPHNCLNIEFTVTKNALPFTVMRFHIKTRS